MRGTRTTPRQAPAFNFRQGSHPERFAIATYPKPEFVERPGKPDQIAYAEQSQADAYRIAGRIGELAQTANPNAVIFRPQYNDSAILFAHMIDLALAEVGVSAEVVFCSKLKEGGGLCKAPMMVETDGFINFARQLDAQSAFLGPDVLPVFVTPPEVFRGAFSSEMYGDIVASPYFGVAESAPHSQLYVVATNGFDLILPEVQEVPVT